MDKGLLLPYIINNNTANKIEIDMKIENSSTIPTKFEQGIEHMSNIVFPSVDPEISVKARIVNLEDASISQKDYNKLNQESFINLNENLIFTDENLKKLLIDMQNDFEKRLLMFKKEYDHRFEIQTCENKRLQSSVASLKSESNLCKRKLQSAIEKLRKLQKEFGDPDDIEEESSVLYSPNNSVTFTNSRPNTTGFM